MQTSSPVAITPGHTYELSIPLWALWLMAAAVVALVAVFVARRRGRG